MFKVKLWLTVVLFVAAGALLLVAGTPRLYEQLVVPLDHVAAGAATGLAGELILDSEQTVTRAAGLANRADVRKLFEPPKRGQDPAEAPAVVGEALLEPLGGRLGAPTFGLIADRGGKVLAKAGEARGLEENVSGFPILADTLTGVMRDGLLRLGDDAYLVATAPVYLDDQPVGVVLLGWSFTPTYADALAKSVGYDVVLLVGKQRVGAALPGIPVEKLREVSSGTTFGELSLSLPVAVPFEMPLLVEERSRFIGHARPLFANDRTVTAIVAVDRTAALEAIAMAQISVLIATVVLAVLMLIMVVNILRSISKPMEVIMDHLSAFAQGTATGILPEGALSGPFVRLGKQINMILQSPPPGSAVRTGGFPVGPVTTAPLSFPGNGEISQPNRVPTGMPPPPPVTDPGDDDMQFDGIPGLGNELSSGPMPMAQGGAAPPPPPADDGPTALRPLRQAPVSDELADSALSGLFDDNADPLAAFRVQPKASPPPPPPMSDPAMPVSPPAPLPGAGAVALPGAGGPVPLPGGSAPAAPPPQPGYNPEATVMFQVPQELIQESQVSGSGAPISSPPMPAAQPTGSFRQPPAPPEDEGRTVIAQIPQELLSASAKSGDLSANEDAHYREVYQEFIRTRQQCGEDTSDLSYDRFVAKLLKNKQQIVEKYHSKSVRFQVYVKQGKAALRAVPVRD